MKKFSEPKALEKGAIGLEEGTYAVGPGSNIPSGVYMIMSEGFNGKVLIPEGSLISSKGYTLLIPSKIPSFRAEGGTYVSGVNFPAGTYSIRAPGDLVSTVAIYDTSGRFVESSILNEKTGQRIGRWIIPEGYMIKVNSAGCYFSVPGGITFE